MQHRPHVVEAVGLRVGHHQLLGIRVVSQVHLQQVALAAGVGGDLDGVVAREAVELNHRPHAVVVEARVRRVALALGIGPLVAAAIIAPTPSNAEPSKGPSHMLVPSVQNETNTTGATD